MNFHLSWSGSLQFRKIHFYVELLQWRLYRFLFLLSILTKHFVYVEKTPKILSAFSSFPILLFLSFFSYPSFPILLFLSFFSCNHKPRRGVLRFPQQLVGAPHLFKSGLFQKLLHQLRRIDPLMDLLRLSDLFVPKQFDL